MGEQSFHCKCFITYSPKGSVNGEKGFYYNPLIISLINKNLSLRSPYSLHRSRLFRKNETNHHPSLNPKSYPETVNLSTNFFNCPDSSRSFLAFSV